ncbi:MAG: hypothetical protein LWX07_02885 [Bacteroidetes bacterium]|nr:hypothetical protein [Bacteroidota bacterium]
MKTKTIILAFCFGLALTFAGCAHTNQLANFNLSASKVLFKTYVSPLAGRVYVDLHTEYGTDAKSIVSVVLGEVASGYMESKIEEKLRSAVNSDSLVNSISAGVKDGLMTYYRVIATDTIDNETRFITETKLLGFKLISGSGGIYASVNTEVTITDRNTAKIVWDNSETSCIPLYDVIIGVFGPGTIQTTTSIINAIRLMNMSGEEMRVMISNASEEAGRKQYETLRDDTSSNYN